MNKPTKLALALFVVVIIAGGIILLAGRNVDKEPKNSSTSNSSQSSGSNNGGKDSSSKDEDVAVVITYDGSNFKSTAETIKTGQKVKVVNASDDVLEFESDPHPVHTDNTELNAGDIISGGSKTFTITKKGTWGYHNHLDASQHGEITVE